MNFRAARPARPGREDAKQCCMASKRAATGKAGTQKTILALHSRHLGSGRAARNGLNRRVAAYHAGLDE